MDIFIKYYTLVLLLMAFLVKGELPVGPLIQPEVNNEVEYSSVSFRCMLHSTNVSSVSWKPEGLEYICIYNQTCGIVLLNSKNGRFTCRCQNTEQDELFVELQIDNITEKDHNTNMTCEATSTSKFLRTSAMLLVKVPAKSVEILPAKTIVQISENTSYAFTCTTSMSRPVPKIRWIVAREKNDDNYVIFEGKQAIPNTTIKGLSYANSTLLYMPNRTVNGWVIFCSVEGTNGQSKVQSGAIKLNITYPPESRLMINGMSIEGVYKVIENSTGMLNCTLKGGNPQPMISWTKCFETEQSTANYATELTETYSDVLIWIAKSYTDRKCTCFCTQMEQNQSLSINVEILYPPSLPTISFGNQIVTNNISVLMNRLLSINCTSDSKPAATYQWMFNNVCMSDEQPYVIESYKSDHGNYTCVATTIMDPTDADKQTVSINSSFELQVLYPPTIGMIKDPNVLEGSTLNLTCPVILGNPSDTQIEWTTTDNDGGESWLSKIFAISNVSRQHDGEYTCTVNNTMFPTFGPEKSGRNIKSFHLNVEYKATIKAFYVDGYEQQTNVTVHERDTLIFRCQVEGKPVSTTSIHFQSGQKLETFQSNDVSYKIVSITCQQTGVFVCSGRNKHNAEQVSKQTLLVFIYCSPRTDPSYPVEESITVPFYKTACLNFTALAYPTPKNVLWQKLNGRVWMDVNTTNNTNTHQSDLNFSLTIYNMLEENFGMYRLTLKNGIGSYEQIFYINAEENEYIEHSNIGSFIAVGVGTFAATVLFFSLAIIVFKCMRTKQTHACVCCDSKNQEVSETSPNVYMTIGDSRRSDKVSSSTYEQLEISEM